jgi:hypothetical protein
MEVTVSLILSIASSAVFTAVSEPMVASVPLISLSMVPGTPMQGTFHFLDKAMPPR